MHPGPTVDTAVLVSVVILAPVVQPSAGWLVLCNVCALTTSVLVSRASAQMLGCSV